jgi:hypothetical protein
MYALLLRNSQSTVREEEKAGQCHPCKSCGPAFGV